jgi:hypothetical protein
VRSLYAVLVLTKVLQEDWNSSRHKSALETKDPRTAW